ncbi:MAG: T9SS type A sorting domain-containing protein [Bacteroidetes bacterium]|nr:T9SS type A sorting domain-containing protein [Bacteroidota bacterium]
MLYCLPLSGTQHFDYFYISGSAITCLPFSVNASNWDISPSTLPLCDPLSGCDFYDNIGGVITIDTSTWCTSDSIFTSARLGHIKVSLYHMGKVVQQVYSSVTGGYSFKTDSLSDYVVGVDTSTVPFHLRCPFTKEYNIHLSPSDSSILNRNFGFECGTSLDYGIAGISGNFRPTYQHPIYVNAGNLSRVFFGSSCNGSSQSGTIYVTFTGPAHTTTAIAGSIPPSLLTYNSATFQIPDFDLLSAGSIGFSVYVDSQAVVGDKICFTAILIPDDQSLKSDTFIECFSVQNSFDPNFKEVYPMGNISTDSQWLTYTVHFQNTGNDTAYNIIVKDTLSAYVDPSSLQYLASSHDALIQVFDSLAVFTFAHIMLPDSATNPELSEGWIKYRVKTKAGLSHGTHITNEAHIYFDANAPVITNTTLNSIDTLIGTGLSEQNSDRKFMRLYPNPNNGNFILETSRSIGQEVGISDLLGRELYKSKIDSDNYTIRTENLPSGFYIITIDGNKALQFILSEYK